MGDWNEKEDSNRISDAGSEPEQTETFDSDDDDGYEEEDEDCDEYDDEMDENEDIPFLRQHFFAIVIAFVASIAVHLNEQIPTSGTAGWTISMFPRFLFRPSFGNSVDKHDHLKGFSRTANISFCKQEIQPAATERLHSMDFYLPREHFESLQAFYVADQTEDDLYADTDIIVSSSSSIQGLDATLKDNEELQCVFEQHRDNPVDRKFKGTTFFYKDPTLEEIYSELATGESSTSSVIASSSRDRKKKMQQPLLSFTGFATKIVNLDTDPVLLYWDGKGAHENSKKLVGEIPPMESIGTATMPGHSFHVTPIYDPSTVLKHWVVTPDSALVFYEPKKYLRNEGSTSNQR